MLYFKMVVNPRWKRDGNKKMARRLKCTVKLQNTGRKTQYNFSHAIIDASWYIIETKFLSTVPLTFHPAPSRVYSAFVTRQTIRLQFHFNYAVILVFRSQTSNFTIDDWTGYTNPRAFQTKRIL